MTDGGPPVVDFELGEWEREGILAVRKQGLLRQEGRLVRQVPHHHAALTSIST